jgi:O-antigen ligase
MLDWPFIDILRTKCGYSIIPKEAAYGWVNWAGLSKLPRVWAITPEPSFWGSFLLIPISMIFPLTSRNKRWKIYMMFYILVLIITFSRSAWFGLVIIVLYNMYDLLKKRKWIIPVNNLVKIISAIIIASGICVYVTIRWHAVIEAIILMKDWSSMERLNTQVDGIMLFIRHPLIGIGWGNTPFYLKNTVTYNFYLQLLLEVGIVGFLVFGVFLLQIWKKLDSFSSKLDFSDQRDFETSKLITGLKTSFFAILIIWLNLPAYNFSYFWFVFAMMITLPKIYAKSVYENIDAKQA